MPRAGYAWGSLGWYAISVLKPLKTFSKTSVKQRLLLCLDIELGYYFPEATI